MAIVKVVEGWKSTTMASGTQFVTTILMMRRRQTRVVHLGLQPMVRVGLVHSFDTRILGLIHYCWVSLGATEFDASGGDGPIALLDCNNVGTDVSSCTWNFGVQGCDHYEDVGLNCSIPQDGDIRLSGNFTGRLEVFTNGEWSTVCSNLFGTEEANVACGDLGFAPEGKTKRKIFFSALASFCLE
jgi:hypothetical protein